MWARESVQQVTTLALLFYVHPSGKQFVYNIVSVRFLFLVHKLSIYIYILHAWIFSRLGCHYMHFDKGHCETDPFLYGCKVYKAGPEVN